MKWDSGLQEGTEAALRPRRHGQGSRCRSRRQSSWPGACVRASGERQAKRGRRDGQRRSWGHSGPGNPRLTPSCRPGSGGGVALKVGSSMNKTSAVILRDGKAEKAEEQGKMDSAASVLALSRRREVQQKRPTGR